MDIDIEITKDTPVKVFIKLVEEGEEDTRDHLGNSYLSADFKRALNAVLDAFTLDITSNEDGVNNIVLIEK